MSRLIGIASSLDNVGKTTIALNLSTMLSQLGRETTLIDLDFKKAGLNHSLRIKKFPITLHEVIAQNLHIKEAEYKHASGLNIIPNDRSIYPSKSKLLKQKILDLSHEKDVICLDTESEFFTLLGIADKVIIVTTLNQNSWQNAKYSIALAEGNGLEVLGVVINRAPENIDVEKIESHINRPVLGIIPEDKYINKAIDKGHPVVYLYPNSISSKSYKRLATNLERRGII